MRRLTIGMMMLLTSELTMPLKAAPMTTPTARSITLPLRAKFLNSSANDTSFLRWVHILSPRGLGQNRGHLGPIAACD